MAPPQSALELDRRGELAVKAPAAVAVPAGEVIVLADETFDAVVGTNEIALVNFYADWCRFSQMLKVRNRRRRSGAAAMVGRENSGAIARCVASLPLAGCTQWQNRSQGLCEVLLRATAILEQEHIYLCCRSS